MMKKKKHRQFYIPIRVSYSLPVWDIIFIVRLIMGASTFGKGNVADAWHLDYSWDCGTCAGEYLVLSHVTTWKWGSHYIQRSSYINLNS